MTTEPVNGRPRYIRDGNLTELTGLTSFDQITDRADAATLALLWATAETDGKGLYIIVEGEGVRETYASLVTDKQHLDLIAETIRREVRVLLV
jgi:hypothetical protein